MTDVTLAMSCHRLSFLLRSQNLKTMSKQVKGKSEPFLKEGQRWGKALDCEKLLHFLHNHVHKDYQTLGI